MTLEKRTPRR